MPCYDPREDEHVRVEYVYRDSPESSEKINELTDRNKKLEAGLCAIITELEKRGIANEVISRASKSGLINLMDFWYQHSKEDEVRLAKEIHKFSEHEQAIIKKLLK